MANLQHTARQMAGVPVGFFKGISYPFKGMKFVFLEHPGLIRYWIFPIFITIAAVIGAWWGSWHYSDSLTNLVWEEPTGDGFLDGFLLGLHNIVDTLVFLVLLATSLFVLMSLSSAIAGPFNAALSAEVERLVNGNKAPDTGLAGAVQDIIRMIALELLKMALYLGIMAPLFICSFFIPVVGQALYSIFGFVFTAFYFGMDYIDYPAERRGMGAGARFKYARGRFMPTMGLGAGVWIFLFVPFLNLLFMPAAVAGGTLMFLDMEGQSTASAPGSGQI